MRTHPKTNWKGEMYRNQPQETLVRKLAVCAKCRKPQPAYRLNTDPCYHCDAPMPSGDRPDITGIESHNERSGR